MRGLQKSVERLQAYLCLKGLRDLAPCGRFSLKSFNLYEKQGMSNTMYLLKISITDGTIKELMLRLYVNDGRKALREYKIMRILREKNLPVPKVYAVEESGKVLGKPFIIMERIVETSAKEEYEIIDAAALSLVKIHSLEIDDLERVLKKKSEYPLCEFRDLKAMIIISMFLTFKLPMFFTKYWKYVKDLEVESKYVNATLRLIHGDYGLDNVVYSNSRAYVVDWESADIADPTFDVAYVCNMLEFVDKLAGRFENKLSDIFLEAYRRHGGITRNLDFYKRLAALKELILIEILTFPGLMLLFIGGLRRFLKNTGARLLFKKLREHLLEILAERVKLPS
ncbi:MAG: phosphotransferase family protein [Thermoproteota archaeon]